MKGLTPDPPNSLLYSIGHVYTQGWATNNNLAENACNDLFDTSCKEQWCPQVGTQAVEVRPITKTLSGEGEVIIGAAALFAVGGAFMGRRGMRKSPQQGEQMKKENEMGGGIV